MHRFLLMLSPLLLATAGGAASNPCLAAGTCCKVCHVGKACGDTCIARGERCHKGAGCACDG